MRDVPAAPEAFRSEVEPDERLLWQSQPGPRGLFLSVLPRLFRDLAFLAIVGAALALGWDRTEAGARTFVIALILFLLWSLVREVREASAAKVSHYLITNRRLIVILPRTAEGTRSYPHDCLGTALDYRGRTIASLDGPASLSKVRDGRATVIVPVRGYVTTSRHSGMKGYRSWTIRLLDVAEPDQAVAALRPPR